MTTARARSLSIVLAAVAVLALGACRPILHVPRPTVASPGGATLTAESTEVTRGSVFEVTATGCIDDFQSVEVRLVTEVGVARRSVAVVSGWSELVEVEVPDWTPDGPATVEASCLEPNTSHASDGADIVRFDYAPIAVAVSGPPMAAAPELTVPAQVTDGVLHVSGAGCSGPVLVSVARGPWLVASAANFRYGRTLVTPEADGSWAAAMPLRYAVSEFNDPAAPGPMTVFATCDGEWFPGKTFDLRSDTPGIHLVGPGPSLLYLSQCPPHNTLSIIGIAERANGETHVAVDQGPGPGYGEIFRNVPLPADTTEVTWVASCGIAAHPRFVYEIATWSAP